MVNQEYQFALRILLFYKEFESALNHTERQFRVYIFEIFLVYVQFHLGLVQQNHEFFLKIISEFRNGEVSIDFLQEFLLHLLQDFLAQIELD